MSDRVLFAWKKYKLTNQTFTYFGYVESLNKIADLEVVESNFKAKVVSGLGLSFWGLLFSFFPGFLVSFFLIGSDINEPQAYVTLFCVIVFFLLGFLLRAKYTLYITKVSGNRGSIDKSRRTRAGFDVLIEQVKSAIIKHC